MNLSNRLSALGSSQKHGITLLAFILAAIITGFACVLFMRGFEFVLDRRLDFHSVGAWCWLTTPIVFLLSIELIKRVAPTAAGTGIPQTIFAAEHMSAHNEKVLGPLLSSKTLIVKIVALFLGVWVGASTGREGPTVQVATCVFLMVLYGFRRLFGLNFDFKSAVVAGGAAGLAAAFNTPLAGVVFAIEELTPDLFASIKDYVLLAIIVAAIAAKTFTGEYTYFGSVLDQSLVPFSIIVLIGLLCGIVGALFSTALFRGQLFLVRWREKGWLRYLIPLVFSSGVLAVALISGLRVLGPGNLVAQGLLKSEFGTWVFGFPIAKMASTLLTYWSGVAGGIFAPCLSIGAALGADVGHFTGVSISSCALIGMAAFLAGTIQAPITSFVIIFEMTSNHQMLLPIMLASLLSVVVARLLGAQHLYKSLASLYQPLLQDRGKIIAKRQ